MEMVLETGADVPVSLSSEILPEFREYERTLVTVMNAYVRPSMRRYLQSLDDKLRGVDLNASVHIVRSDGGLMSIARASDSPAHTMLSGPAGGVSGAAFVAGLAGHRNALGFDMGGTSTDVSLVRDGAPTISRQTALGYYPIKVPSVEVHSVGAGGGSIAHVPMDRSAPGRAAKRGAVPGTRLLRQGRRGADGNRCERGARPPPSEPARRRDGAGGRCRVGRGSARSRAPSTWTSTRPPRGSSTSSTRTCSERSGSSRCRRVSIRATSPWSRSAAQVHCTATRSASSRGCFPVIVPPTPGVLSALGFLCSDTKNEFARTYIRTIEEADPNDVRAVLSALGEQARTWLRDEGVSEAEQTVRFEADVRYLRQGYEFSLDVTPDPLANGGREKLQDRFGARHEQLYGFRLDHPVELVNLRAVGAAGVVKVSFPRFEQGDAGPRDAVTDETRVFFGREFVPALVYDRARLRSGHIVRGPAVITQPDTTTVIHPGHAGEVDEYLNVLIVPVP